MSWNGAGVYSRGYASWTADAAANLPISATKFDTEDNDFAGGINNCLTKDGQNSPTAALSWTIANAVALTLLRQTDGTVFSVGRSGGSNNPALQFQTTDGVGATINLNTPQTLALAVNGQNYLAISAAGGVALTGAPNVYTESITGSVTSGQSYGLLISAGTTSADAALNVRNQAGTVNFLTLFGDGHGAIGPTSGLGLSWNTAGAVVIAAPTAGAALTLNPFATGTLGVQVVGNVANSEGASYRMIDGNSPNRIWDVGVALAIGVGIFEIRDQTRGASPLQINAAGNLSMPAPSSGNTLTIGAVSGGRALVVQANSATAAVIEMVADNGTAGTTSFALFQNTSSLDAFIVQRGSHNIFFQIAGTNVASIDTSGNINASNASGSIVGPVYAGVPINNQTGNYQAVLADANRCIVKTAVGTPTITIPANSSVAFPVGTMITVHSSVGTGSLSITVTTDTLIWAATGSLTSTRTLAAAGVATLIKINATSWVISGTGLS